MADKTGATGLPAQHRGCRSFDMFDTLVARRCFHPHQIFVQIEQMSGLAGFAHARVAAEQALAHSGAAYSFDQIYDRLAAVNNWPEAAREQIKQLELYAEQKNLFAIRQHCAEVMAGDVVVSDMYLPQEFLEGILRRVCGVPADRLYLSCHGKRTGTIWSEIGTRYDLTEHIGDDPTTDIASPNAAGIPATMTTVAHRTQTEHELAEHGFVGLSNWIREVRLSTWHTDPLLRRAQLVQIEVNLPLLFLATIHLLHKIRERGWQNVLFSGRDCYLWYHLHHTLSERLPLPPAKYFHTSRSARAKPSRDYLAYFNSLRDRDKNVVVDLCGTGWSLSRLVEQAGGPETEIYLLHHLAEPALQNRYEQYAKIGTAAPVHSILHRPIVQGDVQTFEELNRAPYHLLKDIIAVDGRFEPVFWGTFHLGHAADLVEVHQETLLHACTKFRHVPDADLRIMVDRPIGDVFEKIYARLPEWFQDVAPLIPAKEAEERMILAALRDTAVADRELTGAADAA